MATKDELWIPLVDEPIGTILDELQAEDPEIARLVAGPRRTLAFKTFAYVKVGLLLGELLVDSDVDTSAEASWVEQLLRRDSTRARVLALLRQIAEEIAADPDYEDAGVADESIRERFRAFAKTLRGD